MLRRKEWNQEDAGTIIQARKRERVIMCAVGNLVVGGADVQVRNVMREQSLRLQQIARMWEAETVVLMLVGMSGVTAQRVIGKRTQVGTHQVVMRQAVQGQQVRHVQV